MKTDLTKIDLAEKGALAASRPTSVADVTNRVRFALFGASDSFMPERGVNICLDTIEALYHIRI